ncbi:MAG: pyruvate dehydrogenase complex dihydrolipoamide acetyltransferase [Polyangia bacterium]
MQTINMPKLSPTMEEGVLAKWTKKVGDKIAPGDVIAEVETDKANMDFPLEDEGVLLKLLVEEGATVKLGDPVAILGEPGEKLSDVPVAAAPKAEAKKPETKPDAQKPDAQKPDAQKPDAQKAETKAAPASTGRVKASPLARKLAREHDVDLHTLSGSGPHGRIVQKDILEAASSGTSKSAPSPQVRAYAPMVQSADDVTVPASQMRKTIAKRLVEAKLSIPHIYLTAEATIDSLLDLREQTNAALGIKLSVNDLVIKALAVALRRIPDANVSWTDAGIVKHGRVDLGVAVSVPDGLITPVIRNADQKGIAAISTEVRALAARAKEKKLRPEEYTGGTASVSNLGMYGVREFTAIINPPEAVILAVGTTEKRAIVVEKNGVDSVVIARRMTLTLSCDHRVVDGVLGAQLLAEVVRTLQNPLALAV